jgi:hypothetical protein
VHGFEGFLIALVGLLGGSPDSLQTILQGHNFRSTLERNLLRARGENVLGHAACGIIGHLLRPGLLLFHAVVDLVDGPFEGFHRRQLLFGTVDRKSVV